MPVRDEKSRDERYKLIVAAIEKAVQHKRLKIQKYEEWKRKRKGTPYYNNFFLMNFLQDRLHAKETKTPGLYGAASNTIDEILYIINQARDKAFHFMAKDNQIIPDQSYEAAELALEIIDDLIDIDDDPRNKVLFERVKDNIVLNPNTTAELVVLADDIVERTFAKAWELGIIVGMFGDDLDDSAASSNPSGRRSVTSEIFRL